MIVDAHHHLWDVEREPLPWMGSEDAAINRTFEPDELAPLLFESGVSTTVLVQAANTDSDTDAMFEQAAGHSWIGAVIAWIDLGSPERTAQRLDELGGQPALRGFRHLIHNEQDPHWILGDDVLASISLLEARGLILELPCVYPRHLGDVPALASAFPQLTIVVDHLAKPPLGSAGMDDWARGLRAAAASANVHAKISGLNTILTSRDWHAGDLRPAIEVALDAFGADRLVCGSDWPVSMLNGSYEKVWRETVRALEDVAPDAVERLLFGTAVRLYDLAPPAAA